MALRVLLADESTTIKKVIQLTLQDFAVQVKAVPIGEDVLPQALEFDPDIIFVDVLLQKKSGYEVCQELKNNPRTGTIPVVITWSGFIELDERRLQAASPDARLEKPFDGSVLRQLIQNLVAKTHSQTLSPYLSFPDVANLEPLGQDSGETLEASSSPPQLPQEDLTEVEGPSLSQPHTSSFDSPEGLEGLGHFQPSDMSSPTGSPQDEEASGESPSEEVQAGPPEGLDLSMVNLASLSQEVSSPQKEEESGPKGLESCVVSQDSTPFQIDEPEESFVFESASSSTPSNDWNPEEPSLSPLESQTESVDAEPEDWAERPLAANTFSAKSLASPIDPTVIDPTVNSRDSSPIQETIATNIRPEMIRKAIDNQIQDWLQPENLEEAINDKVKEIVSPQLLEKMVDRHTRQVVESITWKVLPEIVEKIAHKEIEKLLAETERSLE